MIPDFPEIKKQYHQLMMLALKDKIDANSPMTSKASKKIIFEGTKMVILREDGKYDESEMTKMSATVSFSKEEIAGLTYEQIQEKLTGVAQDMAFQMGTKALETVNKAIEETGNEIPSPDGLNVKWVYEALKRMKISFEDDDPAKPTEMMLFAGPEVIKRFDEYYQSLSESEKEEYQKEYWEIMKIKYQEHLTDLNERMLTID